MTNIAAHFWPEKLLALYLIYHQGPGGKPRPGMVWNANELKALTMMASAGAGPLRNSQRPTIQTITLVPQRPGPDRCRSGPRMKRQYLCPLTANGERGSWLVREQLEAHCANRHTGKRYESGNTRSARPRPGRAK